MSSGHYCPHGHEWEGCRRCVPEPKHGVKLTAERLATVRHDAERFRHSNSALIQELVAHIDALEREASGQRAARERLLQERNEHYDEELAATKRAEAAEAREAKLREALRVARTKLFGLPLTGVVEVIRDIDAALSTQPAAAETELGVAGQFVYAAEYRAAEPGKGEERGGLTKEAWDDQTQVDRSVYYRNLAIHLGAKPEHMQGAYDRHLCAESFCKDAHSDVEWLTSENAETWQELDAAQRERDEARRLLRVEEAAYKEAREGQRYVADRLARVTEALKAYRTAALWCGPSDVRLERLRALDARADAALSHTPQPEPAPDPWEKWKSDVLGCRDCSREADDTWAPKCTKHPMPEELQAKPEPAPDGGRGANTTVRLEDVRNLHKLASTPIGAPPQETAGNSYVAQQWEARLNDVLTPPQHEGDQFSPLGIARAEVAMLRGEGCNEDGDGPCGACLKCAQAERDSLQRRLDTCLRALEASRSFMVKALGQLVEVEGFDPTTHVTVQQADAALRAARGEGV